MLTKSSGEITPLAGEESIFIVDVGGVEVAASECGADQYICVFHYIATARDSIHPKTLTSVLSSFSSVP